MASGERAGFLIGDGAGVGKGRTIAGIMLENFLQGRKKSIWVCIETFFFKNIVILVEKCLFLFQNLNLLFLHAVQNILLQHQRGLESAPLKIPSFRPKCT